MTGLGLLYTCISCIFISSFDLFREANQLSEEMGKETEFAVTLQV